MRRRAATLLACAPAVLAAPLGVGSRWMEEHDTMSLCWLLCGLGRPEPLPQLEGCLAHHARNEVPQSCCIRAGEERTAGGRARKRLLMM
jgi:hypothetical protein